ncbi:MAG: AAA family ATPase [Methyloprofundus sp.]|nr:AAA family ATPase [Methyloprofundus sp.]
MVIIIMGVSGSGKTTVGQQLAADLDWIFSDGDDFHIEENIAKMRNGIPLTDEDRSGWLETLSQYIKKYIISEHNAVIACSALKQQYRRKLQLDPKRVKFVYLKGSEALIKKRLQSRSGHFMQAELLESQFSALEEPEQALFVDITHPPKQISATIQDFFCLSPRKTKQ